MEVFVSPLFAPEYARGKGGHGAMRMDICGDPWKDMRTTSLRLLYAPVSTVIPVPVVS